MTLASKLARNLLEFLKQNEDFETQTVLKTLIQDSTVSSSHSQEPSKALGRPLTQSSIKKQSSLEPVAPIAKQDAAPFVKPKGLSIYDKLVEKVKKACPELRIKDHTDLQNAGIPDCDVILLSEKKIPDVYLSLMKAIDKQFALTESVVMSDDLLSDLLTKNYKLILAPPFVKKSKNFMSHVKSSHDGKGPYIGSSFVIFIEDADMLNQNPSKKQLLWQMIKQILS